MRGLVKLQRWRMVCDVDVEMRMCLGSEQRREQTEKQRRKREKISWEKNIIKYYYFFTIL